MEQEEGEHAFNKQNTGGKYGQSGAQVFTPMQLLVTLVQNVYICRNPTLIQIHKHQLSDYSRTLSTFAETFLYAYYKTTESRKRILILQWPKKNISSIVQGVGEESPV